MPVPKKVLKQSFEPGGSVRDEESIVAANEHKIPMLFTGMRHFFSLIECIKYLQIIIR